MKLRNRSKADGQAAFAFGSAGDPTYRERSCRVVVMNHRWASTLMHGAEPEGTTTASFHELVDIYARDMAGHWWILTGETIVVDRKGRVIDGKARLLACIKSKVPFPVILVTGVEPEAEYGIDDRKTRSKADTLYIRGEEKPQSVQHACEMIVGFLHAESRAIFVASHKVPGLDNLGIARLVGRYPQISAAARFVETIKLPGFSHAALTAARFLAGLLDEEAAERFFGILKEPASDPKSVPARLAAKARPKLTSSKDTKALAILGRCWEAFRMEEKFHRSMLAFEGRVEGDPSGLAAFPDWGLAGFGKLAFETTELPTSVPEDIAKATPERIERYLLDRLAELPVKAGFHDLTPERARAFLASNGPGGQRNRKISRTHLEKLKADIEADRWNSNGQSLKVARSGALLDGQHRCTAVVETGKTIEVVLVEGLNDRIFPVLDGGKRKSYAQRERSKDSHAEKRGAALGVLAKIEADDEELKATTTLKREIAASHPGLWKAVDLTASHSMLAPSVAGALCTLFMEIDEARAEDFIGKVASGANLAENDPAYVLREKLLKAGRSRSERMQAKQVRWAIHAWNAEFECRPLLRIKDTKGPGFPRIAGR